MARFAMRISAYSCLDSKSALSCLTPSTISRGMSLALTVVRLCLRVPSEQNLVSLMPCWSREFSWILFFVFVRTTCFAGTFISGESLCTQLDFDLCILVKILTVFGKYPSNTRITLEVCRSLKMSASMNTFSLPDGQGMTHRRADTSYMMVSGLKQFHSDSVTWSYCFMTDFDLAIFIFPSINLSVYNDFIKKY